MRLVTERLVLRPPQYQDAKDIVRNANNLKVSRYLAFVPYPYSLKDARAFIRFCRNKAKKKQYNFGVTLKQTGKVIGMIGLRAFDRFGKKAEVGCWLGKKYWRKGFGTEAMNAIIRFAFAKLKLVRLEAEIFVENKPSAGLVQKLGFKKEGRKRKGTRAKSTGKWHDTYSFGLLRSDVKL